MRPRAAGFTAEALLPPGQILESIGRPPLAAVEAGPATLSRGLAVVVCTYDRPASLREFLESLAGQDRRPEELIIVDASPTSETHQMLGHFPAVENLAGRFLYFRVGQPLRGLTRQRNFALRWVTTDLVAFFDDDVILLPGCLRHMEDAYGQRADRVVGVGAFVQRRPPRPTLRWRLMLALRMISRLEPGRYERSGIPIPWSLLAETDRALEGDFLPGCAMMWNTTLVRELGFDETLDGYAYGEDLDVSLRVRGKGTLLLAGAARVLHRRDPAGRPDPYEFGYMEILNRYRIHRRALADRRRRDILWFFYAWILDTLFLMRYLVRPRWTFWTLKQVAGRIRATVEIVRGGGVAAEQVRGEGGEDRRDAAVVWPLRAAPPRDDG